MRPPNSESREAWAQQHQHVVCAFLSHVGSLHLATHSTQSTVQLHSMGGNISCLCCCLNTTEFVQRWLRWYSCKVGDTALVLYRCLSANQRKQTQLLHAWLLRYSQPSRCARFFTCFLVLTAFFSASVSSACAIGRHLRSSRRTQKELACANASCAHLVHNSIMAWCDVCQPARQAGRQPGSQAAHALTSNRL